MSTDYEYLLESIEQLDEELEDLREELREARVCPTCWRLLLAPGNHRCEIEEDERDSASSFVHVKE